ncbi:MULTISPECIES: histidine kinase [unclassified Pseudoxanthomonas]|uniref:sensor histidine kinase n=1 Tax=unclassified Pseudoxanthomonas TaxID=2645906 RepID=UPI001304AC29|nr:MULTISPECIES: histidine kinase [unclassified Pseudoxanthomonas]
MPTPPPSALLLQLFRLQEAERARVGRALHNQVGQALSAIKMGAHLVQSEDDAATRAEDLHEIIRASDETVAILRDLHATLHPPQLDAIGLDAALRAEIERRFEPGIVAFRLDPLPQAPDAGIALIAFRIGQALMHPSGAMHVALDDEGDSFALTLQDAAGEPSDIALWQALAAAGGGRLDGEGGTRWRLRLPYGPTSATPIDPA